MFCLVIASIKTSLDTITSNLSGVHDCALGKFNKFKSKKKDVIEKMLKSVVKGCNIKLIIDPRTTYN